MQIHAKKKALGEELSIRAGYSFRGPIEEVVAGPVRAVQMKDLDPFAGLDWSRVVHTQLRGRGAADWLAADDLLFVARGTRFYAIYLGDEPPGPAVCGPHLFHLRVRPGRAVLPAFVAWQINQSPFQRELRRAAEGSSQLSVRRPVLESLPIGIPPVAHQQRIVDLARFAQRERLLQARLLRNREREFELIARELAGMSSNA